MADTRDKYLGIVSVYIYILATMLVVLPFEVKGEGFYVFLRWATSICCLSVAILLISGEEKTNGQKVYIAICFCLCILFNPIAPIELTKKTWLFFDVFTGLFLWIGLLGKAIR
jgi:hypothetical protein